MTARYVAGIPAIGLGRSKTARSWQSKAAFAAGVGVPLGLALAADPAAAELPESGFYTSYEFAAFDFDTTEPETYVELPPRAADPLRSFHEANSYVEVDPDLGYNLVADRAPSPYPFPTQTSDASTRDQPPVLGQAGNEASGSHDEPAAIEEDDTASAAIQPADYNASVVIIAALERLVRRKQNGVFPGNEPECSQRSRPGNRRRLTRHI